MKFHFSSVISSPDRETSRNSNRPMKPRMKRLSLQKSRVDSAKNHIGVNRMNMFYDWLSFKYQYQIIFLASSYSSYEALTSYQFQWTHGKPQTEMINLSRIQKTTIKRQLFRENFWSEFRNNNSACQRNTAGFYY